jgi:multiple sugar transport system substrate-binding protein
MSSKIRTILIIIGVLALAGGGYWYYQGLQSNSAKEPSFVVDTAPKVDTTTPAKSQNILIGSPTASVKLVFATHWLEKIQQEGIYENDALKTKGVRQYFEEYTKIHPDISFEIEPIAYQEYANKLQILSDANIAPDIYQIYSPWGVSYVNKGILDTPPADVIADVEKNYISNSGAIINGKIWGFPTEVNTYALLYNKKILAGLGITTPPKTWKEFVDVAVKASKQDSKGNITQYGVAFLKGNDWQEVDPFLSLLFSNGGKFISDDGKKALFNSVEGVGALEAQLELFKRGATNIDGNFFDFGAGKVAMVIAPPWVKNGFKEKFGADFESTVGTAPMPILNKQTALRYSWFMGVMAKSAHKTEAWNFLKWFTTEVQPETKTTRYGDLLANNIGAIPGRLIDVKNQPVLSNDSFTKVYVGQLPNGVSEPNVANIGSIKSTLMSEIEAAFAGSKTAKEALDTAALKVDKILSGEVN